jgi:hypothetical protein
MHSAVAEDEGLNPASKLPGRSKPVSYFLYFITALAISVTWSLIGCMVAWTQGQLWSFLAEWRATQTSCTTS